MTEAQIWWKLGDTAALHRKYQIKVIARVEHARVVVTHKLSIRMQ